MTKWVGSNRSSADPVLVGSTALKEHGAPFTPNDWDFLARSENILKNSTHGADVDIGPGTRTEYGTVYAWTDDWLTVERHEAGVPDEGTSGWLFLDLVDEDPRTRRLEGTRSLPSPDLLLALIKSHRHKKNCPKFWKHAAQYHFLKAAGAVIRPEYEAFIAMREKETYNYAHPKLKQAKTSFFDESVGVKYKYDHDSLHRAVALGSRPAYLEFAKEGEEVFSSREKFEAAPRATQLASVYEESCVLALERSMIAHPGVLSEKEAFRLALSKVCTSITSGWWRDFAYENVFEVLRMYRPGHISISLERGLKNGVIVHV